MQGLRRGSLTLVATVTWLALALSGCVGSGEASCALPRVEGLSVSDARDSVSVDVSGAWECRDQGEGAPRALKSIELEISPEKAPSKPLASDSAPVADDGTATVEIDLPSDAPEILSVNYEGSSIATFGEVD